MSRQLSDSPSLAAAFDDGSSMTVVVVVVIVVVVLLDGVEDGGLVAFGSGDDFALGGFHGDGAFAFPVHVQQLAQVESRTLQDLDFVDEDVVKRVDGLTGLFDVFADGVGNELVDGLLQVGRSHLLRDDLNHLTADVLDLLRLSVRGLLDLILSLLSESDAEETQSIAVARFHVHASFDHRLPLLHHRSGLVGGESHSVKVGQAITPLNILADETEFAEGNFVVLKIGQRHFVHASLQTVGGDTGTRGLVDGGFTDAPGVEHDGGSDVVPLLASERVDDLLLLALFPALRQTLVLANRHLFLFIYFFKKFKI